MHLCMHVCVRVCMRACVRACAGAGMRAPPACLSHARDRLGENATCHHNGNLVATGIRLSMNQRVRPPRERETLDLQQEVEERRRMEVWGGKREVSAKREGDGKKGGRKTHVYAA